MRDKDEAEVASLLEAPDITCFYDFMFHQSYIVYHPQFLIGFMLLNL
jgi:hypothetical protein